VASCDALWRCGIFKYRFFCAHRRKKARAPDEVTRKMFQAKLVRHNAFQKAHRKHYYDTRSKAIRNSSDDVSMIIDKSGGCGTTYSPRYNTTEKGEPARHTMLKVCLSMHV